MPPNTDLLRKLLVRSLGEEVGHPARPRRRHDLWCFVVRPIEQLQPPLALNAFGGIGTVVAERPVAALPVVDKVPIEAPKILADADGLGQPLFPLASRSPPRQRRALDTTASSANEVNLPLHIRAE